MFTSTRAIIRCNNLRLNSRLALRNNRSSVISSFNTSVIRNNSTKTNTKKIISNGPTLKDFITQQNENLTPISNEIQNIPYLNHDHNYGSNRKVYFDVYGCQMNVNDTEIIWSILKKNNFQKTEDVNDADVALIMTCAIREGAENKIWRRIKEINAVRRKRGKNRGQMKIGILGCMAERLKHKILEKEKAVDVIAGPDSYKDLPRLLAMTENNQTAVNVLLSLDETYADIMPVRLNDNAVTAFVSIMRGCDNMCTYCIVPFTRGRERSRPVSSILGEVEQLVKQGIKEITLLGQNVNSYRDISESSDSYVAVNKPTSVAKGFKTVYKTKIGGLRFADLLDKVAEIDPEVRIRFTSPHPKDFPDEVLELIKSRPNICKNLHLPAQSGNSAVLERMRRGYTREAYLDLVRHIRKIIPGVSLSSDFICGFCDETQEEFEDTITLMDEIKYNMAYLFAYSMREKTTAHRRFTDNVPHSVKIERLQRMAQLYRKHADAINKSQIGKTQLVLIEGPSKKSQEQLVGRNESNLKVVIPKVEIPQKGSQVVKAVEPGDYVAVKVENANSQTFMGVALYHTTLTDFYRKMEDPYAGLTNEYLKYGSMM